VAADKASGTAFGTAQGGVQFNLPAAKQSLETELGLISDLRNQKQGWNETFGGFGPLPQQWLGATPATPKYDFKTRVDQIKGQNFIQAFQALKGAGAITEQEGAKAQAAMARLDLGLSEKDFNEALNDLEEVLKLGYQRLQAQAGSQYQSGGGVPASLGGDPVAAADALLNSGEY